LHTAAEVDPCALQRGFEADWLGNTFSIAVFLGNGLVAILAGLLGHGLVETFNFGPVAPFDAAAVVLLIGGIAIAYTWPENYGDTSEKVRGQWHYNSKLNSGAGKPRTQDPVKARP
jgi:hypothetical protein